MMIRAAHTRAETRRVAVLAGVAEALADRRKVAQRIREEATDTWDDTVAVQRLEGKGGRFVRGRARITGPRTVAVDGREYAADRGLVISTGTQPSIPPVEGLANAPHWTNREAVETETVPESLTVIGGGAIGLELAQVFARFGSRVAVLEVADRTAYVDAHDRVRSERLLVATGRRADLSGLGVGAAGIDESARFVRVDENLRAADGVWAVGDVTGEGLFTHVAMYQARIATADILGEPHEPVNYRAVPRVTFTDPEVGVVGLTEAQAREQGVRAKTASTQIPSSARGWIHKAGNEGLRYVGLFRGVSGAGRVLARRRAGRPRRRRRRAGTRRSRR